MENKAFEKELEKLINKHSVENEVNMPDFILANMVVNFISNVGKSVKKRDKWLGYPEGDENVIS